MIQMEFIYLGKFLFFKHNIEKKNLNRIFHSSVVYKDKMYVFGGLPVKGCKEPEHRLGLRVYDFVSNSWVVITTTGQEPPLPCKVENFKIFFLNYC